jgi:hypothetical protein
MRDVGVELLQQQKFQTGMDRINRIKRKDER